TINGSFSPNSALSAFNGEDAGGTWRLQVDDAYTSGDSGTLNSWSLELCTTATAPDPTATAPDPTATAPDPTATAPAPTATAPAPTATAPASPPTGNDFVLDFDGQDDYVEISNESQFDLNQLTVAFWVKTDGFTKTWEALVTKGDSAWRIHRCENGQNISFGTSGLSNLKMCSNATFNDSQWHHVTAVFDGSTKYLYVDGVLDISTSVTGAINSNNYPVMIGNNAQQMSRYFGGQMDDVQIFDHALSQAQIEDLANQSALASWSFNEGSGNVVLDSSGNDLDGTIYGQPAWTTDVAPTDPAPTATPPPTDPALTQQYIVDIGEDGQRIEAGALALHGDDNEN
ncbi:MAG: hypothetical protein GY942_25740, partial [Aestuariibacter sp.]|nr:hypothetical protein [Aestuariibacter sp.]